MKNSTVIGNWTAQYIHYRLLSLNPFRERSRDGRGVRLKYRLGLVTVLKLIFLLIIPFLIKPLGWFISELFIFSEMIRF